MAFAVDRQGDQLQTTLANHPDLDIELTVDDHSLVLVALKTEFRTYKPHIFGKWIAKTRQTSQRQLTLEGRTAIGQLAWVNVRWNRPIQHRGGILGMGRSAVKGNSTLSAGRQHR
ncbi:hypothetical protein GCM10017624_18070 [Azotobacter vinelandii]|nr:hypothetical protein GCM10017624_18070 [Azotobacter vinelandii]